MIHGDCGSERKGEEREEGKSVARQGYSVRRAGEQGQDSRCASRVLRASQFSWMTDSQRVTACKGGEVLGGEQTGACTTG